MQRCRRRDPTSGAGAGFALFEVLVTLGVVAVVVLGATVTLTRSAEVGDKAAARVIAADAVESIFEYVRAMGPAETIAEFGPGSASEYFVVYGLESVPGAFSPPPPPAPPDGGPGVLKLLGSLLFGVREPSGSPPPPRPAHPHGRVELVLDEARNDGVAARFGCPTLDLDGDGAFTTRTIDGSSAHLVPVYVSVRWRTPSGESRLDAYTIVGK
jgi:hypothetical protein